MRTASVLAAAIVAVSLNARRPMATVMPHPLRISPSVEIHVVDVGQGDGIWIHTCNDSVAGNDRCDGRNIVIDGGPDGSDAKNPLLAYLRANLPDTAIIDAVIVTHPHNDHYPGASGVFRHYQVCDYYDPGYPDHSKEYLAFRNLASQGTCRGQPTRIHLGLPTFGTPDWGRELQVKFLYAYPGTSAGLGSGNTLINNTSIVMKITIGTQSMLFMGDAEGKDRNGDPRTPKYVEARLLARYSPAELHATVLKVAHHGSETSSTLPFIAAVNPAIVVVSSGRKKFEGTYLPDRSTLHRYCAFNSSIRIYRTDQNDAEEHRTNATSADHDDITITMDSLHTTVSALEDGKPFVVTACSY